MTISQAINQLWVRSGKPQDDYASILGCRREHLNAIIAGREPGTPLMLERAIVHAGLDWDASENEQALRMMRNALAIGGQDRLHVLEQAGVLQQRQEERKRPKVKPEPVRKRS